MKKTKYRVLIPLALVIVAIAACSKSFLEKPPLGTLNPEIVATEAGVQGLLIGAYSLVDGEGAPGDGFASGLFYGLLTGKDPQRSLDLGWAHGALLTTYPGDTTMATIKEVEGVAAGGSARVQR